MTNLASFLDSTTIPTLNKSTLTPYDSVPSPFLPDTDIQYAWDSTCLGLFKTCPRLYQYQIIDGWGSRDESVHLRFGIEYHAALEHFDHLIADGADRPDAIHETLLALTRRVWDWNVDRSTKAGNYKNRDTILSLVIDYLDHFDPDPAITYIKSDSTPAVELSFRFGLEFSPSSAPQSYLLCGHLDRVVSFNRQLLVMDRKTTTTSLGPYYFQQFNPHNQMSLYTFAGRVILDAPIAGVIIDAAQVKLEDPNAFARGFTFRTESQISEWISDLQTTLALAETYALNHYWPMNDTSCDKFGGCRFREICARDPHVRPNFLKSNFNKQPETERWNPLRAR